MLVPNRHGSSRFYRYGFNGKEKDDEVKGGEGLQYDYGFRIYDPRLGKFLSNDPLTKSYPWYTPYQFAGNTPIQAVDLDGAEEFDYEKFMAALKEGITYQKKVAKGFIVRATETVTGTVAGLKVNCEYLTDPRSSQFLVTADIRTAQWKEEHDPSSRTNIMRTGKAVIDDYYNLFKQAVEGDPEAMGGAYFEILLLMCPEAKELQAEGIAMRVEAEAITIEAKAISIEATTANKVQKINGRSPRNFKYAGKIYTFEPGTDLAIKYPKGVSFNEYGFPDFSPYARKTVDIGSLNKSPTSDFRAANKAAGYSETPAGYTWHHVEHSTKLELVPTDLHNKVSHTGGAATNAPKK